MFNNSKLLAGECEAMPDREYFYLMTHDTRGHYFSTYANQLVNRFPKLATVRATYEQHRVEVV